MTTIQNKVVIQTVMVCAAVALFLASTVLASNGQEKVDICHHDRTLTVGAPAVAAHLAHGDTLGACGTGGGGGGPTPN